MSPCENTFAPCFLPRRRMPVCRFFLPTPRPVIFCTDSMPLGGPGNRLTNSLRVLELGFPFSPPWSPQCRDNGARDSPKCVFCLILSPLRGHPVFPPSSRTPNALTFPKESFVLFETLKKFEIQVSCSQKSWEVLLLSDGSTRIPGPFP